MTGKVFVVQRPAYFDRDKRGWVNKYDLTPAKEFGELVFLLRPGNIFYHKLEGAIGTIREGLDGFDGDNDHILAVGDPVAIAATVMVASEISGGNVSILKFDRQSGQYEPYPICL